MNVRTQRQDEAAMFFQLSQEATALMRSNPTGEAVTTEAEELRDDIDLLAEMTDWPEVRVQARNLIDRFDGWRAGAH